MKKGVKTLIFAGVGALVGLIYYNVVGCSNGSCAITSNVYRTVGYFAVMGLWISFIANGGCCCSGSCDIDKNDIRTTHEEISKEE